MATHVPIEHPGAHSIRRPNAGHALAGLVGTAGAIHLAASVEHVIEDWWLGAFFVVVGVAQLVAARFVYGDSENERALRIIAAAGLGVALLWVVSRTTGLPFGPDAGEVAKVGVADTIATLQELTFAAIVAAVAWRGERAVAWMSSEIGIRLVFAVLSLTLMLAAFGGHEH